MFDKRGEKIISPAAKEEKIGRLSYKQESIQSPGLLYLPVVSKTGCMVSLAHKRFL